MLQVSWQSEEKAQDVEFYSFQSLIKEAYEFFRRDLFSPGNKFLEVFIELIFI